jgi:hypothetical protein
MKFATVAMIAVFAGYLSAQTTETKTTTTTSNTVNLTGTLVDQGCYTTHTKHTETTSNGENSTTTTETTRIETECPATTTTTSFGMITPEGRFVRFDDAGNTRVVEMFKSNKDWRNYVEGRKPVKVRVVGNPNGEVFVIREIQ